MLTSEANVNNHRIHGQSQPSGLGELQDDRVALAAAAHDLCNHLQVVTSALGLIQRSVGEDAMTAMEVYFSGAKYSLERASQLSRKIVDAGWSNEHRASRVSLAERLAALRDVVMLAAGPSVLVEYATHGSVPDVLCDADALDEAILNIVVNSGRAMSGGGRISISATCEMNARHGVPSAVLRIVDNGCGMPPEVAARAFEPRFTTRAAGEGSGTGLAMVASFVRSAGGTVELESCPGVGTIVTLRLPGLLKSAKASERACPSSLTNLVADGNTRIF